MEWIEEYKLLEKDNLELNVIRLLREKIDDISELNEKYQLFLKEIREVHLFENRKVQIYLIEKLFEKIFEKEKVVVTEKKREDGTSSFFTMKKIEPVTPFYKRNIQLQWKIKSGDKEEEGGKKRKFGEICVKKREDEKKENKKKMKK